MELKIIKTENKKEKPSGKLGFGKFFTDHMFIMEYENGEWKNARIQPWQDLHLAPSASVLHYAQGVFEGAKAYKNDKGEIRLFRLNDNLDRMCDSAERVCMPAFDKEFVYDAIKQLIFIDEEWIPTEPGTALYIRPTMIATEPALGVHASKSYYMYVIVSPVGAYYANGLAPVKLFVEENYVRAAVGGTGGHKVIGNYAASMKAGEAAQKKGYDQAMWLDAKYHRYVEEVGAMNIFFVMDGVVYTPALRGSILPGITRRSVIALLKKHGIKVKEGNVDIRKVAAAADSGALTEIFGTGTAAVISPVGCFCYQGKDYVVNGGEMGEISKMIYDELTGIQNGKYEDKFGWVDIIKQ
ncbi:MAG: branched-chain amino acid aminotransferase [Clostridia bacterium]|nr:branched-chain amino acid aminotransferase [Clostridia bacterium]